MNDDRAEARTTSHKLSSDLHMNAMVHMHPHVYTNTKQINSC